MSKLKAESDLQQSRLMEYQVASEYQEQQKTRLEEEVKDLVKRVQNMEGIRQKKDLDAASKISELEGKVSTTEHLGALKLELCHGCPFILFKMPVTRRYSLRNLRNYFYSLSLRSAG